MFAGPSVSDNGYIVAPLVDEVGIASINYTGGERTRSRLRLPLSDRLARGGAADPRPTPRGAGPDAGGHRVRPLAHRPQVHRGVRASARRRRDRDHRHGVDLARWPSHRARDRTSAAQRARRARVLRARLHVAHRRARARRRAVGHPGGRELVADVRLHAGPSGATDGRVGVPRRRGRRQRAPRARSRAQRPRSRSARCCAASYDIGRLIGSALARADHLTATAFASRSRRSSSSPPRAGTRARRWASGTTTTRALKGRYLVLREWRDGQSVQVDLEA